MAATAGEAVSEDIIKVDAQEVVDLLEEQLAWLAVAGETFEEAGGDLFHCEYFRNADPWVNLGKGDTGGLSPSTVDVGSKVEEICSGVNEDGLSRLLRGEWSRLRRPLQYARVIQGSHGYKMTSFARLPPYCKFKSGKERGLYPIRVQHISLHNEDRPDLGIMDFAMSACGSRLLERSTMRPGPRVLQEAMLASVLEQCEREKCWLVEVSMSKNRTGLALRTDAVGAREFVNGLGRMGERKPLVHWVREHYRRRRTEKDPALVRSHLRGTQVALTRTMWVTIRPSIVDIDTACNGARFESEVKP